MLFAWIKQHILLLIRFCSEEFILWTLDSPPQKTPHKDHRRRRDTALKAVSYRLLLTDLHVQLVRMHAPQLTKNSRPETNSHKLWGVCSHTQCIQLVLAQAVKLCLLFCFFCYIEKNGVVGSPWWWCYTVQLMAPEKLHFQGTAVQSRYSWQCLHGDVPNSATADKCLHGDDVNSARRLHSKRTCFQSRYSWQHLHGNDATQFS